MTGAAGKTWPPAGYSADSRMRPTRLRRPCSERGGGINIAEEAADVANFAMMIADVCGGLKPATSPGPSVEEERLGFASPEDIIEAQGMFRSVPLPKEVEEAFQTIVDFIYGFSEGANNPETDKALCVIKAALSAPPVTVTSWHLHEWATGFDEDISHSEKNLRDIFHELGIAVEGEALVT